MNARVVPLLALAALVAVATVRPARGADAAAKTLAFRGTSPSSGAPLSVDAAVQAAAIVAKRCAHAGIDGVTSGPNAKGDAAEIRLAPDAVAHEDAVRRFVERPGVVEFRVRAETSFEDEWRERKLEGATTTPPGFEWRTPEDGKLAMLVETPEKPFAEKLRRASEKAPHDADAADAAALQKQYDEALASSVFGNADVAEATVERSISTYGAATHLRIAVRFALKDARKAAFEKFTGDHVGRALAIIVDGKVHLCLPIRAAIPGEGKWIGPGNGYTDESAQEIAALLANPPLPCRLVESK